jgi:hypothetical protein
MHLSFEPRELLLCIGYFTFCQKVIIKCLIILGIAGSKLLRIYNVEYFLRAPFARLPNTVLHELQHMNFSLSVLEINATTKFPASVVTRPNYSLSLSFSLSLSLSLSIRSIRKRARHQQVGVVSEERVKISLVAIWLGVI